MSEELKLTCEEVQLLLPDIILSSLSQAESQRVLDHVAICRACTDAMPEAISLVTQSMLSDVNLDLEVPSTIKTELMMRIHSTPQLKRGIRYDRDGVMVVRSNEVRWMPTGVPGMEWRPLSSKRLDDRRMSICRMKAGSVLPAHRHEGQEEIFILSGTLMVQGVRLIAGDYCHAELGTTHSQVVALTDTEFLVSTDPTQFL